MYPKMNTIFVVLGQVRRVMLHFHSILAALLPRNSNKTVACGLAMTVQLLILFQALAALSVRKIIP